MQSFELPSHLFRWCLTNTDSGNAVYSYEVCFGQYLKIADRDSYLWRSYDRRLKPLIHEISVRDKPRVLEVGSGFGHDLVWAACHGALATGVEVNSEFVEISKRTKAAIEHHTGQQVIVDIRRGNLLNMPENEEFDVIFMKDVFHHLEPREEVVAKLGRLLSPGGTIIIVEPNALNPLIQLQMFRIRGFRTVLEKTDAATGDTYLFGNERLVNGGQIRRLFARHGVKGAAKSFRFLPTKLALYPMLSRSAHALERVGLERILLPACIHTIFVGHKA